MAVFVATLVYELDPSVTPVARKLLRAQLVGRRYLEAQDGVPLPEGCLWCRRSAPPEHTVDDVRRGISADLSASARAAGATVLSAWVHISGGGTFGVLSLEPSAQA